MAYDGTVKINTVLDETGLEKGLKSVGGLAKKGFSTLESVATTAIKGVTVAVAGMGTAMAAITKSAVDIGMEFEAQMSRVEAISGATEEEFEKLNEQAKELGATTSFSASEAAKGMENLASAGFKVSEIIAAMPGMLDLAASSGENLATSADIAASTLRGFGLEADQAGHVADVLAKNAADTNAAVKDTGEAMKYIAPVAHAMGLSLEEITASIGLMANAGIQGSQAGTTLRGALTRLTNPTEKMCGVMESLGLSFFDSEGKMLSLTEMTEMLQKQTAHLTDEERNQALAILFGQEALSGMLALIAAGPEQLSQLTTSLKDCDGAAQAMAITMLDNLKGAVEEFGGATETFQLAIYDKVQEPLKGLAQYGTEAVNGLTEALQTSGVDGLIQAGGKILADIVLGVASKLPEFLSLSSSLVTSFVSGIMSNSDQILVGGQQILSTLIGGAKERITALYPLASQVIVSFISGVQEYLPQILSEGRNLLSQLGVGLQQAIPQFLSSALPVVADFTTFLNEEAGKLIDSGIQFIYNIVDGLISALPDLIAYGPTIIKNLADIINENVPKLLIAGANIIIKLINGIVENIPKLVAEFPKIVSAIIAVLGAVNWLSLGKNIINGIISGVKSLAQSIPNALKNIGNTALNAVKNINWSGLGNQVINLILTGIKSLVTSIPNVLKSIGNTALNAIKNINWTSLGKNIVSGIASGVTNAASSLVQSALNVAKNAFNAVKNFLGIHSPSRKMRDEVGIPMIEGASVGIEEESPEFAKTAVNSAKNAMKKINASDYVKGFQSIRNRSVGDGIANTTAAVSDSRENFKIASTQTQDFDYAKMAQAFSGAKVILDGREVGEVVTPYANDNMNEFAELEERGVI